VLLIYQLKPEGVVNNWLLARLRMRFNVLLCQRHVYLWTQLFFDGCTSSRANLQLLSYL